MNALATGTNRADDNPFDLQNNAGYAAWRETKLQDYGVIDITKNKPD